MNYELRGYYSAFPAHILPQGGLMKMEEQLPIYQNGISAGVLLRREEGLHSVFTADCPDGAGIRRLWLCAGGGAKLLLGTLAPEQGRWRLTRRLARSGLERQGLCGTLWGELRTGDAAPAPESETRSGQTGLPIRPRDPVIAQSLGAVSRGRWQREDSHWRLTFPWQTGQPVPLLPLFCFAQPQNGALSFLLGEEGYPITNRE